MNVENMYLNNKLTNMIEDHITWGSICFDDLTDKEKGEMISLCINEDTDTEYQFIWDHEDYDVIMHHIKKYVETGKREYAVDLGETIRKQSYDYYVPKIDDIFTKIICEREYEHKKENGLSINYHNDNGEIYWSRI